jgi:hypothetical protein
MRELGSKFGCRPGALKNRFVAGSVAREVRSWEKTSDHAQAWIELKDIVQSGSGRKRGIDGEET